MSARCSVAPAPLAPDEARLRDVVARHLDFVWRTLRNLGVGEADLEDETQKVFLVVAQRLSSLDPTHERSFVFGTARRIASHARRCRLRRREDPIEWAPELADPVANPEHCASNSQAMEILVEILDSMTEDTRHTFMLFELEQLSLAEIAYMDGVPLGTVASRLRRAREHFRERVERLQRGPAGRRP